MVNKWITSYVGLLFFVCGVLFWITGKILKLVVFLFTVIIALFVYAIRYYSVKLLKGRVVPIFARKG
jgi:hypothetical protein